MFKLLHFKVSASCPNPDPETDLEPELASNPNLDLEPDLDREAWEIPDLIIWTQRTFTGCFFSAYENTTKHIRGIKKNNDMRRKFSCTYIFSSILLLEVSSSLQ